MASNDYTKELGMASKQPTVPLPFVLLLIAAIIAAGWYGFSHYKEPSHRPPEAGDKAAATPAPGSGLASHK